MKSQTDRNSKAKLNNDSSRDSFIPMNDLLRRNHKDRVADYLESMDDQTQDQLISAQGMVTH